MWNITKYLQLKSYFVADATFVDDATMAKLARTQPPQQQRFYQGDMVMLKKENPFKGTLRAEKPYRVEKAYPAHIALLGENGTIGYFSDQHFEIYEGMGRRMPYDASMEYEDAIAAREIYDGQGTG